MEVRVRAPGPVQAERTRCPKGHELPDLQQVVRTLGLSDREVVSVYIVGSHLWETCSRRSDWDMVIVVDSPSHQPLNTHAGNFEAFIVSREDYISLVREHSLHVLTTLWLPKDLVLRENFDPRPLFQLDTPTLLKSLQQSRERDLRVSEKHFRKLNPSQGKKVIVHCVRCQMLGIQVKRTGRISDYTAGQAFRELVLANYSTEWEDLKAIFQPVMEETWTELTT